MEHAKDEKVQTSASELEDICMKDGESVDELSTKLMTFVTNIRLLGEKVEKISLSRSSFKSTPEIHADRYFHQAVWIPQQHVG